MRFKQLIATAVILSAAAAHANAQGPPGIDPLVPGRAMIRLQNTTLPQFLAILNQNYPQLNASAIDAIPSRNMHLLQFTNPSAAVLEQLEDDLSENYVNSGLLTWGELLYESQAPEGKTGSTWVDSIDSASVFATQYITSKLGLSAAQSISTGNGVLVAVIDTGVDPTHQVLQNRIAPGGFNFIANSTSTLDVGDGADNDGDGSIDEMTGHGTYVAGLVALVAPQARILPITVLNSDGVGDGWAVLKGVYFAIDRGVEVINLSLSSTYESHALEEAIMLARSLGIGVAAAAGNFNRNNIPEYPAMIKREDGVYQVFGVGSTTINDTKAAFSNYSNVFDEHELFICAPGASELINGQPDPARSIISILPGQRYAIWEGTSMSTPLLAGTLALIRAQHPEWPSNLSTWENLRIRLTSSAVNIYPLNPQYANPPQLGVGRLNAAAAVALGPKMPRRGDLNGDGLVNITDLMRVLNEWGMVHTSSDIDNDGRVNVNDLLIVLNHWG